MFSSHNYVKQTENKNHRTDEKEIAPNLTMLSQAGGIKSGFLNSLYFYFSVYFTLSQ